jgi:hypothetical protein
MHKTEIVVITSAPPSVYLYVCNRQLASETSYTDAVISFTYHFSTKFVVPEIITRSNVKL